MSAHETLGALPLGAWAVVTTPQGEAFRCQRVASGVYVEGDLTIAVEDVDPDAAVLPLDGDDPFDPADYDDALLDGLTPRQREDAGRLLRDDPREATRRAVRAMNDCRGQSATEAASAEGGCGA